MSPTERRAFEGESWLGPGVQHLISSRLQDAHRNFEHHCGPSAWWQFASIHASLGAEALELRGMLDDGFGVIDGELQAIFTRPCRNWQIFDTESCTTSRQAERVSWGWRGNDTRGGFWGEKMGGRSTGNWLLVIIFNVSEGPIDKGF
jgi:hypothetical protein